MKTILEDTGTAASKVLKLFEKLAYGYPFK